MFDDLIDDIVDKFGDSLVIKENNQYKLSYLGTFVFIILSLEVYNAIKKYN